jgi:hypothetical protein
LQKPFKEPFGFHRLCDVDLRLTEIAAAHNDTNLDTIPRRDWAGQGSLKHE